MKLTFIGTSGSMISKERTYPAILVNDSILMDCGEGTTQKLLKLEVIDKISTILITHLHNDHFLGIISLIWYYWLNGRADSLHIVGPPNSETTIKKILKLVNTPNDLGDFKLNFSILEDSNEIQSITSTIEIKALKMEHAVDSFAYKVVDGDTSVCYSGDTRPNDNIIRLSKDCNMLILESTFLDELQEMAHKYHHCTPSDAAEIATKANVRTLVLFHISPAFKDKHSEMLNSAKEKFKGKVILAEDLMTLEI